MPKARPMPMKHSTHKMPNGKTMSDKDMGKHKGGKKK